jgi:hypothetical protein
MNHALSTNRTLVKIATLTFEIKHLNHDTKSVHLTLNHDSKIEVVNLILNYDKKIVHSISNYDTIANRIVFAIVNTNSQSTQTKTLVRWIKFDAHLNQIIKHLNFMSLHYLQKSINQMNESSTQKSFQRWISFIRTKKNSKTQKIILILNWRSISINANLLICQSTRTKKAFR